MEIRGQRKADASVVHAAIAAMTFVGRPMLLLSYSLRCLLRVTYKMGLDLQNGYKDGGFD